MNAADIGIPELEIAMQAYDLPCPVLPYGAVARSLATGGTRHFYVDDAKFEGCWARPDKLLASNCTVAIEANFSTWPDMPRIQVLHDIYRKRAMARYWQGFGVRIVVDLNVDPAFRDLALLGVPRSWGAYAVRSQRGMGLAELESDYRLACEHAGGKPDLFLCVGGGKKVREAAQRRGWHWVPEHSHVVRGLAKPYGGQ